LENSRERALGIGRYLPDDIFLVAQGTVEDSRKVFNQLSFLCGHLGRLNFVRWVERWRL
jgi:hypothetical protein